MTIFFIHQVEQTCFWNYRCECLLQHENSICFSLRFPLPMPITQWVLLYLFSFFLNIVDLSFQIINGTSTFIDNCYIYNIEFRIYHTFIFYFSLSCAIFHAPLEKYEFWLVPSLFNELKLSFLLLPHPWLFFFFY